MLESPNILDTIGLFSLYKLTKNPASVMVLAAVGVGAKKTKNVMQEKLIAVVYSLRTY